jgi:hypothetical protein
LASGAAFADLKGWKMDAVDGPEAMRSRMAASAVLARRERIIEES